VATRWTIVVDVKRAAILAVALAVIAALLIALKQPLRQRLVRYPLAYAIAAAPVRMGNDIARHVRILRLKRQGAALAAEYLRGHPVRKLQIGSGYNNLPGWLNTDISPQPGQAYLDATEPFPFPNGSFHYVASEHLFEHLTYQEGRAMLREACRILAPGGKIRIATPNLLKLMELFQPDRAEAARHYIGLKLEMHRWPTDPTPECFILNLELSSFGHRFVYDPETLRHSLAAAGFHRITEFGMGESDDPELRGVEKRQPGPGGDMRAFETMVLQAVRP
jgi:predicted SAM-dependent methyltransferase